MARFGIDLTAIPKLRGGVGFYLEGLIGGLQQIDSTHEYSLIVREDMRSELRQLNSNFQVVPVGLSSRPFRLFWEQTRLPALATALRLDLLHSPHYTRPLRPLTCASVVGIMDLTFFVMPQYHTRQKRVFFRGMIPRAARLADRLITISEHTRQDAVTWLNAPLERIDVTPLAVSSAYRCDIPQTTVDGVRQRYALPRQYVLFVGTLEPRKNLARLLEAYELLCRSNSSMPSLVLAGAPGWHTDTLMATIRRLGERVRVLGYVQEDHLPGLYAGAQVFVYPSLYEGFGIPVLEALSCGVPTVTSKASATAEVAGNAAELVDPSNVEEIARGLQRLMTDTARRAELQKLGPQRAAAFSWTRTARLTLDSYERALAGRRS